MKNWAKAVLACPCPNTFCSSNTALSWIFMENSSSKI